MGFGGTIKTEKETPLEDPFTGVPDSFAGRRGAVVKAWIDR